MAFLAKLKQAKEDRKIPDPVSLILHYRPKPLKRFVPQWWLYAMPVELQRKIAEDKDTRCSWSLLMGSRTEESEQVAQVLGSIHAWPAWTASTPSEQLPDKEKFIEFLIQKPLPIGETYPKGTTVSFLHHKVKATTVNPPLQSHLLLIVCEGSIYQWVRSAPEPAVELRTPSPEFKSWVERSRPNSVSGTKWKKDSFSRKVKTLASNETQPEEKFAAEFTEFVNFLSANPAAVLATTSDDSYFFSSKDYSSWTSDATEINTVRWRSTTEIEDDEFEAFINLCLKVTKQVSPECVETESYVSTLATVPSLLNGATPQSTSKIEKHFGNIGQLYSTTVSGPSLKAYAKVAHKAWPYLQALMTPPDSAKALCDIVALHGHRTGNIWFKILASRMVSYGVTPMMMVIAGVSMFPKAAWSIFFRRSDFGDKAANTLDEMGFKPPYERYERIFNFALECGTIIRAELNEAKDAAGKLVEGAESGSKGSKSSPVDPLGKLLLKIMRAWQPREGECPEYLLQGDAFLEDYLRWVKNPLIMYTGVEGMSSKYPDLAYFAVQLTKRLAPGSNMEGYAGAPRERCKLPFRVENMIKMFIQYMECSEVDTKIVDHTLGAKIAAAVTSDAGNEMVDPSLIMQAYDELFKHELKEAKKKEEAGGTSEPEG